jgi:hypothetical protein
MIWSPNTLVVFISCLLHLPCRLKRLVVHRSRCRLPVLYPASVMWYSPSKTFNNSLSILGSCIMHSWRANRFFFCCFSRHQLESWAWNGLLCYGSESRSREVVTGLREGTSERVFKPGIPPRNSSFFLSFRFSSIRSFSPESNRLRDIWCDGYSGISMMWWLFKNRYDVMAIQESV